MSSNWQQILALDAVYQAQRTPNNPNYRTLYIRRRSQLLHENEKNNNITTSHFRRNEYMLLRSKILSQHYGVKATLEDNILRSKNRSFSLKSPSQVTLEDKDSEILNPDSFNESAYEGQSSKILPTTLADASRAIVGNTSISENYAFSGVHHLFEVHTKEISRVLFGNDDERHLAISSYDGNISLCYIEDEPNKSRVLKTLKGHTASVMDLCWSQTNDLIVSASLDGTLRVWSFVTAECVRIIEVGTPVNCCAFQPLNNNLIMCGGKNGTVHVFNISTGKIIKNSSYKTNGCALCMCADTTGRLVWVGDERGFIFSFLIDLTSGKLIKGTRTLICQNRPVTSLVARSWIDREARNPSLLVSVAANMFCLYRVKSNNGSLEFNNRFPIRHQSNLIIRSGFCPLISFRQGACVLSGSEDGCVYLFNIQGQSHINKLQGHSVPVLDVCFNHNESFLASGDAQGIVIIWKKNQST